MRSNAVVPGLKVVYCASVFFSPPEEERLRARLKQAQPHVVIVAMGQPGQEAFACRCAPELPNALIYCVGGLFDYIAGANLEPPHWMRRHCMEWSFRLVTRPQRMWRRYVVGIPQLGAM